MKIKFVVIGIIIILALFLTINYFKSEGFTGDTDPCGNFSNISSDAIKNSNPSLCNSITDNRCLQTCISKTAYSNHNETYCGLINDEYAKSSCYAKLAPSRGAQVCNLITIENEIEGFYCLRLHSSSTSLNKGGFLCASLTLKEECMINAGGCELLTSQKLKDICLLEAKNSQFYSGTSDLDCYSLSLPESQKICISAKEQKAGFVGIFTSENLEATCGNNICDIQEGAPTCPQDCKKGSGGCAAEGNLVTEDSVGCCDGLVEETKAKFKGNGEFICKDIPDDRPKTCIKSGDGVCGSGENLCNSPLDCK